MSGAGGRHCRGPRKPRHRTARHPRALYCWPCWEMVHKENERRREQARYIRRKLARLTGATSVEAAHAF